jgi:hypothetical protein
MMKIKKNTLSNITILGILYLYPSVGPIKKGLNKVNLAKSFIINGAEGRT